MSGTWNYRIVRYADGTGYGLHEVHYDADGMATAMSTFPVTLSGCEPGDIRTTLDVMRHDASQRPVFDQPAEWARRQATGHDPLMLALHRLSDAAESGIYAAQLGSAARIAELVASARAALADVDKLLAESEA